MSSDSGLGFRELSMSVWTKEQQWLDDKEGWVPLPWLVLAVTRCCTGTQIQIPHTIQHMGLPRALKNQMSGPVVPHLWR